MTDVTIIEKRGAEAVELANSITITDNATYQMAVNFVREILKPRRQEIDKTFDPLISDAWKGHKNIKAEKTRHEKKLIEAEQITKITISNYVRAEEEKRREAERKRQEEERKIREEEDRRRREEEARKREQEEKIRKAREAEEAGKQEEADEILDSVPLPEPPKPTPPPAPRTVVPDKPKAEGASVNKYWSAEVVDVRLLCKAVADGVVPASFVKGNEPILNSVARADKEKFNVPGVRAVSRDGTSIR